MTRSVHAGGFAAAAFLAAIFGVAAPAQAQVAPLVVVEPAAAVAGAPVAAASEAAPAATTPAAVATPPAPAPRASLEELAATFDATEAGAPVAAASEAAPAATTPAAVATPPAPAPRASLEELAATFAATEAGDVDQECLANAVFFEARGEPVAGQLAVAEVVLNRSRSGRYPTDICAVVKQPAQFSFVRRGQFPQADRSSDAWRRAVAISRIARDKLATALPQNVLWYHAAYVAPGWGKRLRRETRIGQHIFYS